MSTVIGLEHAAGHGGHDHGPSGPLPRRRHRVDGRGHVRGQRHRWPRRAAPRPPSIPDARLSLRRTRRPARWHVPGSPRNRRRRYPESLAQDHRSDCHHGEQDQAARHDLLVRSVPAEQVEPVADQGEQEARRLLPGQIAPSPPRMLVPPITAAAIAVNSSPVAMLELCRAAREAQDEAGRARSRCR